MNRTDPFEQNKQITPRRVAAEFAEYALVTISGLIGALAMNLFLIPSSIVSGGFAGIGIMSNTLFGLPVGMVTLALNIPLMFVAYYLLGGWRVIAKTVYLIIVFSVLTDLLGLYLPAEGITDNLLLNAIFAGVVGGISGGIALRVGATGGGTGTLGRILQMKAGLPISTGSLLLDGTIIAASGLLYGWEAVLYAILGVAVYGIVVDYVLEGPSLIQTATIVTEKPVEVADHILFRMNRGVTGWNVTGMYTGAERTMLFVAMYRAEASFLRQVVTTVDPSAFIVMQHGHSAFGEGFRHARRGLSPSAQVDLRESQLLIREGTGFH